MVVLAQATEQIRKCRVCGAPKGPEDFYRRENGTLRTDCKSCTRKRSTSSPSKMAKRVAAAERRRGRVPFDPAAYKARWYQKNRDRLSAAQREWAASHPDEMRAYRRRWQASNLEQGRIGAARHLARKRGNDARLILESDLRALKALYRGLCAYCQQQPAAEWDHVIPLARGGRHAIGNLLPACQTCNRSKSAKTIMEWRLSKRRAIAC